MIKDKELLTWLWDDSHTLGNVVSDTTTHSKTWDLQLLEPNSCRSNFYSTHGWVGERLDSSTLLEDSLFLNW